MIVEVPVEPIETVMLDGFAERLKSGRGLVIARVMSKVCVKFPLIPLSLIAQ